MNVCMCICAHTCCFGLCNLGSKFALGSVIRSFKRVAFKILLVLGAHGSVEGGEQGRQLRPDLRHPSDLSRLAQQRSATQEEKKINRSDQILYYTILYFTVHRKTRLTLNTYRKRSELPNSVHADDEQAFLGVECVVCRHLAALLDGAHHAALFVVERLVRHRDGRV
jgi:hypothetical protein